jgi:hypothetical protein
MSRARGDKPANSPIVWLLLAITAVMLYSLMAALVTVNDCGDLDAEKEWVFFPPHFECQNP